MQEGLSSAFCCPCAPTDHKTRRTDCFTLELHTHLAPSLERPEEETSRRVCSRVNQHSGYTRRSRMASPEPCRLRAQGCVPLPLSRSSIPALTRPDPQGEGNPGKCSFSTHCVPVGLSSFFIYNVRDEVHRKSHFNARNKNQKTSYHSGAESSLRVG